MWHDAEENRHCTRRQQNPIKVAGLELASTEDKSRQLPGNERVPSKHKSVQLAIRHIRRTWPKRRNDFSICSSNNARIAEQAPQTGQRRVRSANRDFAAEDGRDEEDP